jgi:putative ABC transport system ATP-binding protein
MGLNIAMTEPVLELAGLGRRIDGRALFDGVNLAIGPGERVAIMGQSGLGKTTLLHLAAGMDVPDEGQVSVCGQPISDMPEPQRTQWRARHIGLVFQDFNLIDSLTVEENIELPLWLLKHRHRRTKIVEMAEALDIAPLLKRLPQGLSGGEKQRVAIARALIHQPDVVLADEPTGSLDEDHAQRVLALFAQATQSANAAVLLVTHNPQAAATCERIARLQHGALISES